MSKIPQGEWNAIAARYQSGESISKIARSYGCTPPAIHYILKRSGRRPATIVPQAIPIHPVEAPQTGLVRTNLPDRAPAPVSPNERSADEARRFALLRSKPVEPGAPQRSDNVSNRAGEPATASADAAGPAGSVPFAPKRPADTMTIQPLMPSASGNRDADRAPNYAPAAARAAAAGLDAELHSRAEAAIASFRSSFDAALVEGSADVREQLRQAANDLMRVAARTTMVLDRINAHGERSSSRAHNYPRSAHTGEDFTKLR